MSKSHRSAGQFNLKGKKFMMLGCMCCEVADIRERELKKTLRRELEEEIRYPTDRSYFYDMEPSKY